MEIVACSDTDKEYMRGFDEEELFYADFDKKKLVDMMPPFSDKIENPGAYEFAEANMPICKHNLDAWKKDFKDLPVVKGEYSTIQKEHFPPSTDNSVCFTHIYYTCES